MLTDMSKIILPVVRRVMPSIIANQILSVQPMASTSGSFFSTKWRRSVFDPPEIIISKGNLVYQFYSEAHPEIFDWLSEGCVWAYTISTNVSNNLSERITTILFEDVKGAVEFKVRF